MKRKILSVFLLVMVVVFGIVGCKPYTSESLFIGQWSSSGLMSSTYLIYKDNTWSWNYLLLGESGKWVHNGDNTITLINTDNDEEIIAEYHSERIYDKDNEGNKLDTYTEEIYLLIDGVKYYKQD